MHVKSISILFEIGKYLTITSSFSKKLRFIEKIYIMVVVWIIVIFSAISIIFYRNYIKYYMFHKIILKVIVDINLILLNALVSFTVVWNDWQWRELTNRLKYIISLKNVSNQISKQANIALVRIVGELFLIIYVYYYWLSTFGGYYFKGYTVSNIQLFLFSCFKIILIFILSVLLSQYQMLNEQINNEMRKDIKGSMVTLWSLEKYESAFYFMKDTVDVFNEIFSFSLFLTISYTTFYILNVFDYVFESSNLADKEGFVRILVDLIIALLHFVSRFLVFMRNLKLFVVDWHNHHYFLLWLDNERITYIIKNILFHTQKAKHF